MLLVHFWTPEPAGGLAACDWMPTSQKFHFSLFCRVPSPRRAQYHKILTNILALYNVYIFLQNNLFSRLKLHFIVLVHCPSRFLQAKFKLRYADAYPKGKSSGIITSSAVVYKKQVGAVV